MRLDVLVFGGGAAGLWCLHQLRRSGYHTILLESDALGSGQTIRAQGIIHGGGKYALRGVRDFAAVQATSLMPARWRRSIAGEIEPNLSATRVLSERCHLWLPRGSVLGRLQSLGMMGIIAKAGLLATEPEALLKAAWPAALADCALAVYALAEPVIATGSFLTALADQHRPWIFRYEPGTLRFTENGVQVGNTVLRPRSVVLTAGTGTAALLALAGMKPETMQRRPLCMVLVRGDLPELFGHCVIGGKTGLTITTPVPGIWQVGGEIAERLAAEKENCGTARSIALREIRRCLPGVALAQVEIALYSAVRAEARMPALRRPSGVHASELRPGLVIGWPTKLSMVPLLADEILQLVRARLKEPSGFVATPPPWPSPVVARYPWEEAQWFAAD